MALRFAFGVRLMLWGLLWVVGSAASLGAVLALRSHRGP